MLDRGEVEPVPMAPMQMQEIRMCFQTYFNLYGDVPSEKVLVEWLGTSFEDRIPEYLDKMNAA